MTTYNDFLNELDVYPDLSQIDEASNFGQDAAVKYITDIDADATVIVEDGDIYVKWSRPVKNAPEFVTNAQSIFDEHFSEKIIELQSK